MIPTIEKVILLQAVDVFEHLSSEDLSHIAAISEELEFTPEQVLYKEGSFPDSMYLILNGKVRLHNGEKTVMTAEQNDAFGTWALFDDEPRVVTATAIEAGRMLRIDKEDFLDLLTDHVRITQGIMKSLVQRVRGLMARVAR